MLEHDYELSYYDRASAIYTKEKLMDRLDDSGTATPMQVDPGEFDRAIPDMQDPG